MLIEMSAHYCTKVMESDMTVPPREGTISPVEQTSFFSAHFVNTVNGAEIVLAATTADLKAQGLDKWPFTEGRYYKLFVETTPVQ